MSTNVWDLRSKLRDCRDQITWAGDNQVSADGAEFLALLDVADENYEVVYGLEVHLADGSWLEWDFDESDESTFWQWHKPTERGDRLMRVLALPESLDIDEANPAD